MTASLSNISGRFPRTSRLLKKSDFANLFKGCLVFQVGFLCLRACHRLVDADNTSARLGFALAKKIVPRAVDRNKVKRCCRGFFRQRLNRSLAEGWDFLLSIRVRDRSKIRHIRPEDLDLEGLWNRWERRVCHSTRHYTPPGVNVDRSLA